VTTGDIDNQKGTSHEDAIGLTTEDDTVDDAAKQSTPVGGPTVPSIDVTALSMGSLDKWSPEIRNMIYGLLLKRPKALRVARYIKVGSSDKPILLPAAQESGGPPFNMLKHVCRKMMHETENFELQHNKILFSPLTYINEYREKIVLRTACAEFKKFHGSIPKEHTEWLVDVEIHEHPDMQAAPMDQHTSTWVKNHRNDVFEVMLFCGRMKDVKGSSVHLHLPYLSIEKYRRIDPQRIMREGRELSLAFHGKDHSMLYPQWKDPKQNKRLSKVSADKMLTGRVRERNRLFPLGNLHLKVVSEGFNLETFKTKVEERGPPYPLEDRILTREEEQNIPDHILIPDDLRDKTVSTVEKWVEDGI
jgi:hypothetical protein